MGNMAGGIEPDPYNSLPKKIGYLLVRAQCMLHYSHLRGCGQTPCATDIVVGTVCESMCICVCAHARAGLKGGGRACTVRGES